MNKGGRPRGIAIAALQASVTLGLGVLVAGVMAASASGAIKIYETSEDASLLGKIRKAECRLKG